MARSDALPDFTGTRAGTAAERAIGLAVVAVLHGVVIYVLLSHRILVVPDEVVTLFVETLQPETPPQPVEKPKPVRMEKPRQIEQPQTQQLVAEAPATSPAEPVAPPPAPAARIESPPVVKPAGPVMLEAELSVSCPGRTPPAYPALSRRLGEEGKAVLRVELDEQGGVAAAVVASSSGHARLDQAALDAVRHWHCTPARRDGRAVRAVAMQPFRFVLQ